MSGHSKWSTIKRQKGTQDAKRGQLFTKLSNAITIAVKEGQGFDPESNFKLRLIMDRARASNMPKENIERAIARASGKQAGDLAEVLYEGFGPGGVAVIVEAVTDNRQRTISEVKNVFEKNGGSLGSPGSVLYLFNKRGEIIAKKNGMTFDDLLAKGIEAGAEDMEEEGELVFYYTDPVLVQKTKKNLELLGLAITSARIVYIPVNYLMGKEEAERRVSSLVERLEELDDVQDVYTNLAIEGSKNG